MDTKRTNIESDAGLVAEDVLALRGSGWEGDLEQLRAGWSRGRREPRDDGSERRPTA